VCADLELPPGTDETRNCGELDRELLLRTEAEVVLGRAVRRCRPTARFVRFLQPEAADPNRRTYRRAPRRGGRRAALRSWLPTSCLRTTGVLDRREAGRPGCCYRPKAEARSSAIALARSGSGRHLRRHACNGTGAEARRTPGSPGPLTAGIVPEGLCRSSRWPLLLLVKAGVTVVATACSAEQGDRRRPTGLLRPWICCWIW
jgi:hypothetical protein